MAAVHTQILRLSGLSDSAPAVERHLDSWIASSSPAQLVGLIDTGALSILREAFEKAFAEQARRSQTWRWDKTN